MQWDARWSSFSNRLATSSQAKFPSRIEVVSVATVTTEERYLSLLVEPIKRCSSYKPKFGTTGSGVSLDQFRELYEEDPLYTWVGLNSPLMYAAHKAAGGMTSIYRQLGIGCERLLRQIIRDQLSLTEEQVLWEYKYEKSGGRGAGDDGDELADADDDNSDQDELEPVDGSSAPSTASVGASADQSNSGKFGIHKLDARIQVSDIQDEARRAIVNQWILKTASDLGLPTERAQQLKGVVFEIRQGYKSADSKRQNADLRFGVRSYNENYLPVICIVSTQASETVCTRYRAAQILVLRGKRTMSDDNTFAFFKDVVQFDLAGFFERNSARIRKDFERVLAKLLSPDESSSTAILEAVVKAG